MHDTLRIWLNRGVDGFRIDVVHLLGKDPDRDDGPRDASGGLRVVHDHDETHPLIPRIRSVTVRYANEPVLVGEVYLRSTGRIAKYYGDGDVRCW